MSTDAGEPTPTTEQYLKFLGFQKDRDGTWFRIHRAAVALAEQDLAKAPTIEHVEALLRGKTRALWAVIQRDMEESLKRLSKRPSADDLAKMRIANVTKEVTKAVEESRDPSPSIPEDPTLAPIRPN